jgi:hypothetical protein
VSFKHNEIKRPIEEGRRKKGRKEKRKCPLQPHTSPLQETQHRVTPPSVTELISPKLVTY